MTKRTLSLIAASFVVATGLFWARMLTSPPVSEAAINPGLDVARDRVEFAERPAFLRRHLSAAYRGARHPAPLSEGAFPHAS